MPSQLLHTVTPAGQGGDYNTLYDCIAHIKTSHANLVSSDVYADVKIDGTWSSEDTGGGVSVSSITTDATHYLHIYTTAAARFVPHSTVWQTGAYILHTTTTTALLVDSVNYVYIDGLQLYYSGASTANVFNTQGTLANGANIVALSNCVVKGPGSDAGQQYGIYNFGNYARLYVYNCIVYNFSTTNSSNRSVVNYYASNANLLTIYSSTIIGGYYGLRTTIACVTAKNCYVGGQGAGGCYNGTITQTKCASSDASGSEAGLRSIAVSTTADSTHAGFVNVTPGSEDFHLKVGSPLIGVGADTSGDAAPMNFTTDIDGDTRS